VLHPKLFWKNFAKFYVRMMWHYNNVTYYTLQWKEVVLVFSGFIAVMQNK